MNQLITYFQTKLQLATHQGKSQKKMQVGFVGLKKKNIKENISSTYLKNEEL